MRPVRSSGLAAALTIVGVLALAGSAAAKDLRYTDILRELTDLDRLTVFEPGVFGGQCSSYSREEYVAWATNADSGNYIRVEENGEGVLIDQEGPGCIFRIWSANPMGKIRIYLDGAEAPTYEWEFRDLFTGEQTPFIEPLVYRRDRDTLMSASNCYVPIPFARHIKITSVDHEPQFYIVNYLTYPKDWTVESFRLPLSAEQTEALHAAASAWARPGTDPKPALPGQRSIRRHVVMQPGQTVNFAQLPGPGVIRAIRASVETKQRYAWRKIVLSGAWDGATQPQVHSPLGGFFGFDWDPVEYGSLIAGYQGGTAYFHYPMPYREMADLKLTSFLEKPARVTFEVEWAPLDEAPANMLYFFARWRHERDSRSLDYRLLETAGQGHYVGTTLAVDHPVPGWWGEGDEKVWIDEDEFPRWIGTGSEDYFGDAWGIRYLSEPSYGCTVDTGRRTSPYRWHFTDRIPFSQRFRMTIENYGPWFNLEHDEYEYSSVAFWYQKELVPPVGLLRDHTYVGGNEYLQTPSEYPYTAETLWPTLDLAELRSTGRSIPWTVEAEDLLRGDAMRGLAQVVSDADKPYEYNGELAVTYPAAAEGTSEFTLYALADGVYDVLLYTDPGHAACPVSLTVDGQTLEVVGSPEPGVFDLGVAAMTRAGSRATFRFLEPLSATLDCIQLRPASKAENAVEIEDLPVLRTIGGAEVRTSAGVRGPSAGRYVEVSGDSAGDGLALPAPEGATAAYVLGLRAMVGDGAGVIQAFVDGQPIGPAWDLAGEGPWTPGDVLPMGPVPVGAREVEIRLVGAEPAATRAGLDYFIWLPLIVHPESEPGVTAKVIAAHGCQVRTQDLGERFVGGHHLWVQPSSLGASVEIALNLPETGEYELELRYTTSWDYALVQASLDGVPLGEPVDLFSEQVEQTEPLVFGPQRLEAGDHVLRFETVGKNPESAEGYLMGLDYVKVTRR